MSTGKVVLGVIAGAAAGAVLGILFAPDKGSNTRKKITKKGEEYVGDLKGKLEGLLDNFNNQYEAIKDEAEDMMDKGSAKLHEAKKEIKKA